MPDGVPSTIGPYTVIDELGHGGMGVVFRAHDPALGRDIALKVLPASAPVDMRARFVREGKVAARLHHPNIVSVLAAGEDGDIAWLAQDLIEGRSLDDLIDDEDVPPGEAARIVHAVAEALAHAHANGVIHRDIKPGNILLSRDGVPFVADFGLARDVEGTAHLSRSGQVLGTPHYMSPEQASGRVGTLDGRTDVWACGVVLYELLSNALPFAGESAVDVLSRVVREDPRPLLKAAPHVPRDLAVIAGKCMAKVRDHRYGSAQALADDLQRFMDGEAIRAKPPSVWVRLRRAIARRKLAAGVAAAGLLGVGAVAAVLVPQRMAESRRADAAAKAAAEAAAEQRRAEAEAAEARERAVERLRSTTDMALDAVLSLRRAGDRKGMARFAAKVEAVCREAIVATPESPEPHFRLGRMYRAMLRDEEARAEQAAALGKDSGYLPALYESVVLDSRRFRTRMARIIADARTSTARRRLAAGGAATPERSLWEIMEADAEAHGTWQGLQALLRQLEDRADGLTEGQLACLRGFALWINNDRAAARRAFGDALKQSPELIEAYGVAAEIAQEQGDYPAADQLWTAGVEFDRGYLPFRLGRARTRKAWAGAMRRRGLDATERFAAAIADFEAVLAEDPDDAVAWFELGGTRVNHSSLVEDRGRDPLPALEKALGEFNKAVAIDGALVTAWLFRGNALIRRARVLVGRGGDGGPDTRAGIESYDRGLKLAPERAELWSARGHAYGNRAVELMGRGGDAGAAFAKAEPDFTKAIECNPADAESWMGRGLIRANWGSWLSQRGEKPVAKYAAAVEDYQEAIKLDPKPAIRWLRRADVFGSLALWLSTSGGNSAAAFDAAALDYAQALQRNPERLEHWTGRATLWINRGYDAKRRTQPSSDFFRKAIADAKQATQRNPNFGLAWRIIGLSHTELAGTLASDLDARAAEVFGEAEAAFREAIRVNPRDADAWASLSSALMNWGVHKRNHAQDPGEQFEAAIAAIHQSIAINPRNLTAIRFRGFAHYNRATWRSAEGKEGYAADFAAALRDFEYVVQRVPGLKARLQMYIDRARTGK
ncbi:MAG: protein kinase domain-containing protein [Planctomycetota bacterium]|jgi:serine/threonine-protein kinase